MVLLRAVGVVVLMLVAAVGREVLVVAETGKTMALMVEIILVVAVVVVLAIEEEKMVALG
jgi:hypothetical protein